MQWWLLHKKLNLNGNIVTGTVHLNFIPIVLRHKKQQFQANYIRQSTKERVANHEKLISHQIVNTNAIS